MLYWMCKKTNKHITGPQLLHAIRRNFGGLDESWVNPEEIFCARLPRNILSKPPEMSIADPEVSIICKEHV